MLETGGKLRTWALPEEPVPGMTVDANALADHRIEYLDYEGPLSEGRGTVTRWDQGTYEVAVDTTDRLVVELRGERLRGRVVLSRSADDPAHLADCTHWRIAL